MLSKKSNLTTSEHSIATAAGNQMQAAKNTIVKTKTTNIYAS
jgi:hypothetical protein